MSEEHNKEGSDRCRQPIKEKDSEEIKNKSNQQSGHGVFGAP